MSIFGTPWLAQTSCQPKNRNFLMRWDAWRSLGNVPSTLDITPMSPMMHICLPYLEKIFLNLFWCLKIFAPKLELYVPVFPSSLCLKNGNWVQIGWSAMELWNVCFCVFTFHLLAIIPISDADTSVVHQRSHLGNWYT